MTKHSPVRVRKVKKPRWPDYDRVDTGDAITFGTTLYLRNDGMGLRIVFPAGDMCTFAPMDEAGVVE